MVGTPTPYLMNDYQWKIDLIDFKSQILRCTEQQSCATRIVPVSSRRKLRHAFSQVEYPIRLYRNRE